MAAGQARFDGIPVAVYRDNSVKRFGNSHVIAFKRRFALQRNKYK